LIALIRHHQKAAPPRMARIPSKMCIRVLGV
jgi:hypothetical protein